MGRLYVVRHGQASLHAADYDLLSSLGEEQARLLGAYWAERGVRFGRAYVGPRRRHRQTHDAVAAAYAERGLPWPAPEEAPELDEHDGPRVVEGVLRAEEAAGGGPGVGGPALAAAVAGAPVLEAASAAVEARDERARSYLRHFARVTREWARGELHAPGIESFQDFRARVERGVQRICADANGGGLAVAFTSGGPVAASAGLALGLSDEKTLELSWAVSNSSVSEFLYSGERFSLAVFNAAPHVGAEQFSLV